MWYVSLTRVESPFLSGDLHMLPPHAAFSLCCSAAPKGVAGLFCNGAGSAVALRRTLSLPFSLPGSDVSPLWFLRRFHGGPAVAEEPFCGFLGMTVRQKNPFVVWKT